VLSEEGGEGGGGDVGGGEAENLDNLSARILVLSKIMEPWWLQEQEGAGGSFEEQETRGCVYLTIHSNTSKKIRIAVFEHFTHQLVIVLVDELVTVCPRS